MADWEKASVEVVNIEDGDIILFKDSTNLMEDELDSLSRSIFEASGKRVTVLSADYKVQISILRTK